MKSVSEDIYKTIKSTFNLIDYGKTKVSRGSIIVICRRRIEDISRYRALYFRDSYVAGYFIQSVEGI